MPTILRVGLENAAAASVLALIAAAAGLFLRRRPALRHCLWLLVLIKLVTPPVWAIPVPWFETRLTTHCEIVEPEPDDFLLDVDPEGIDSIACQEAEGENLEIAMIADDVPQTGLEATSRGILGALSQLPLGTVVPWVWAIGSALTLASMLIRIRRFRKALALAKPAAEHVVEEVDRLAIQLGLTRCPRVVTISGELSPVVWAFGRSAVMVIPADLCKRLTGQQFEALVTHELAHLARRDHWVRQFELVVTVLFWWLPVVWWARRGVRDAEEQCCDAWVVWAMPGASRAYAETLLEAVDFLSGSSSSLPVAASGFGHVQHLKRRLVMIMSGNSSRTLTRGGVLAALGFATFLLPVNPTWGQKTDEKEKTKLEIVISDGESPHVAAGVIALDLDDLSLPALKEELKKIAVRLADEKVRGVLKARLDSAEYQTGEGDPAKKQIVELRELLVRDDSPKELELLTDLELVDELPVARVEALHDEPVQLTKRLDEKQLKEALQKQVQGRVVVIQDQIQGLETKLDDLKRKVRSTSDPAIVVLKKRLLDLQKEKAELKEKVEPRISILLDSKKASAEDREKLIKQLKGSIQLHNKGYASAKTAEEASAKLHALLKRDDDDEKDADDSPEAKAKQDKLRAELEVLAAQVKAAEAQMKEASKRLADSHKRLAEARRNLAQSERRRATETQREQRRTTVRVERNEKDTKAAEPNVERTERRIEVRPLITTPARPNPPVRGRVEVRTRVVGDEQERRLSDLEKKLDKILGELENIKKTEKR